MRRSKCPTIEGKEELEIPAGTATGEVFRLRGRGMPDPHARGKGDLLVQVHVEVPKSLTPRQEELLRELAEEEHTNVTPHRKSFFEKLRDYFVPEDSARKRAINRSPSDTPIAADLSGEHGRRHAEIEIYVDSETRRNPADDRPRPASPEGGRRAK